MTGAQAAQAMVAAQAMQAGEAMRAVRRQLTAADGCKIAQVVAMVDALPARGQADALIAALRPRLAGMHLPRPLGFTRLLFTPLDPVLLPGHAWRRGSPALPRTALAPLGAIVRAGMAEAAAGLSERLARRTASEGAVVLAEGRMLWPAGAAILADAPMPPDWQAQSGLAEADFGPVCAAVGTALAHAVALVAPAEGDSARIAASLSKAARAPATADAVLAVFAALALTRLQGAEARLDAIENQADPAARPAIRRARAQGMAFVLDRLASPAGMAGDVVQAAECVQRDAALLEELTGRAQPGQRSQLHQVRVAMDERCRARFQAAVDADLAADAPDGPDGTHSDEGVLALERAARALHRFEQAARRIGGGEFYDRALRDAAARIAAPDAGALHRMDRARLVELLLGPDAAMAMLEPPPAQRMRAS